VMLLTGQRRTEVGEMAWGEVDFDNKVWRLARDRTKADRAHEVPLSDVTLSVIADCPRLGDFVFTATGRTPIVGWGSAKGKLDELAPAPEWHLHDLRRTCATFLAKLGTDRIVISKILNHAEAGVTSIYDRHRYDAEARQALNLWANRLTAIVEGGDGNVVQFMPARG